MRTMKQQLPKQLILACMLGLSAITAQADVDTKSLDDYLNETESGELLPIFKPQLPHK